MERFMLKENGSDVRKEVIGGITTFLWDYRLIFRLH
jgi:xanthine/uracil/vitamin C permease (AzgA family)